MASYVAFARKSVRKAGRRAPDDTSEVLGAATSNTLNIALNMSSEWDCIFLFTSSEVCFQSVDIWSDSVCTPSRVSRHVWLYLVYVLTVLIFCDYSTSNPVAPGES